MDICFIWFIEAAECLNQVKSVLTVDGFVFVEKRKMTHTKHFVSRKKDRVYSLTILHCTVLAFKACCNVFSSVPFCYLYLLFTLIDD